MNLMLNVLNRVTGWASSRKGAITVLLAWLIAIVALTGAAPSAKMYSVSAGEGSVRDDTLSAEAKRVMEERFPSEDGLPALVVFHQPDGIDADGRSRIGEFSRWLASGDKPADMTSALPFHELSAEVQERMFSQDGTTMVYSFSFKQGLASDQVYEALGQVREWLDGHSLPGLRAEITGPAGIAADTLALFRNTDLVLLFATIGLILVLLVVIYRSPLLALMPLVIAGVVYQAADRLIGLGGKNGWFVIDSQALSIMLILLFAVLTDYCLFVFSRYREELRKVGGQFEAMKLAMSRVGEPILFSGGTVLVAMLALLAALFKPYHNFAPVFAIAMAIILLGGLTLIPAVFSLLGRRAFWPFAPRLEAGEKIGRQGLWARIAASVVKRPAAYAGGLLVLLLLASANVGSLHYSYNLLKSFPEELSSRQGFELLERHFPKGKLAPVSVVLESTEELALNDELLQKLMALTNATRQTVGIDTLTPEVTSEMAGPDYRLPRNFLSEDKRAIKWEVTLADNPYDAEALRVMDGLRQNSARLLQENGLGNGKYSIHFAGQTAEQLDVSLLNKRDTVVVFSLIAVLILIMLLLQTRSLWMALLMLGTILLSYTASLGLGWMIFSGALGYEAISYRIPMYTFVFLVALGVDYNIMLVSRIREEAAKREWREAIRHGVAHTGSVISSAGIILAATFAVLITQPMQELFLFGITMAMGIVLDTFVVRGILLPSILAWIGRKTKQTANAMSKGDIGA